MLIEIIAEYLPQLKIKIFLKINIFMTRDFITTYAETGKFFIQDRFGINQKL